MPKQPIREVRRTTSKKPTNDPSLVLFQGQRPLKPGEVQLHSLKSIADKIFGRKLEDVKEDWRRVSDQIKAMIEATSNQVPKGFGLESVEISLGFSAKGEIVFIAEAGVEASIAVTFKRPKAE